ncbi:MAG: hypothetical protein ABIU30_15535 [Ferruginibacter sp.]
MMQPEAFYIAEKKKLAAELVALLKKKSTLGWARFFEMLLLIASIYFAVNTSPLYLIATVALLIIFAKLVYTDINNGNNISHTKYLIEANEDELLALSGGYFHFGDGANHTPHDHLYANDIDLFGRASLFQYINRTTSEMGSAVLAEWLLQPAIEETIHQRQTAIKELAIITPWRQKLRALGKAKKIGNDTKHRLHSWMQEEGIFLKKKTWRILKVLAPVVMLTIVALNIAGFVSNPVRNYFLLGAAFLAYYIAQKVVPILAQVSKMAEELSVLSDSILLIEKTSFQSPLLQQLHQTYQIEKGFASGELKALKNILARLDYRLNPVVFIPLAILLQWDLQQVIALEKWKKRNQQNIRAWFDALGTFEGLCSLSTLHFNHPDWSFPTILPKHFAIQATDIGHPLISAAKRVNNDIAIDAPGEMMLVTGSNMAGKSTYLRSIGINVVLTMAGSVVCAKSFALSPVQLMTSMRIADNLEENTSTFYAELKKLKTVIEKVNNNEKVFILLDEILRGTNSLDRHTGSEALIRQLIKHNAVGIIATHDTDLAKLHDTYPKNILNYHFDAQVSNDELYFDYRLKEGVCNSINASILMKKIGIEL